MPRLIDRNFKLTFVALLLNSPILCSIISPLHFFTRNSICPNSLKSFLRRTHINTLIVFTTRDYNITTWKSSTQETKHSFSLCEFSLTNFLDAIYNFWHLHSKKFSIPDSNQNETKTRLDCSQIEPATTQRTIDPSNL